MKKEWLWAACVSAVLGAGVLLLSGGNTSSDQVPWTSLNQKLEGALAIQEETQEEKIEIDKVDEAEKEKPKEKAEVPVEVEAEQPVPDPIVEPVDLNATPTPKTTESLPVEDGKVHINSADRQALMELPGIGEKKAQAIIDYRAQQGPFQQVTDIVKVKGIGAKMLEKMLPDLAL